MKKILFLLMATCLSTIVNAQWVTNNNDIGYTTGKVGIGTTSPSKLLTIASSADVYMRLAKLGPSNFFDLSIVTHTAQIGYTAGTSTNSNISFLTNGVSRMYLSDDGKVGIGTTAPMAPLEVRGDILAKTSSSTNSYIKAFAAGTGNAGMFFDASDGDGMGGDYAGLIQKDNLEVELTNYGDNAIKFRTNDTNRVTILGDGRVGIGTISPTEALDIRGSAILKTSSSTSAYVKVFAAGTGNAGFYFDASDGDGMGGDYAGLIQKDNLEVELNNYGSNPIRLRTANTDRITILGGGNIGIGTTAPATKLEVKNSSNNASLIGSFNNFSGDQMVLRNENTTTGSYTGLAFVGNGNELLGRVGYKRHQFGNGRGEFFVSVHDSGVITEAMTISKEGNMGIGNVTPLAKLDVENSLNNISTAGLATDFSGDQMILRNMNTSTGAYAGIAFVGNGNELLGRIGYKRHAFGNGRGEFFVSVDDAGVVTEALTIDKNGNMGVGVTDPTHKLEVNGNALVQGEVYSTKIRVSSPAGNWPDYVFEGDYDLMPLNVLSDYLKTNKHLPEVPSAKEVEAKGQDLGDIQATLLKKVEELTLYMIEQDKKQLSLEERLKKLEEENEKLRKELKK